MNESDQARLPVFRLLLVVQGLAAIVFGVVPLLLPRTFASVTGYSGDDEFVYRLAGAATTGYLVAAIAASVWLALLVIGHGGLLAPVIAAAATTFAVLLVWLQRSIRGAPA